MTEQDSSDFYNRLPILNSFFEIGNPAHYHSLPEDWFVGVTDIVNSTEAIENDRYKTVNILGVSPIIGVLNTINHQELPYNFGGDGCVICIPPGLIEQTKAVFATCQQIGKTEYDLELRAALIPIKRIRDDGFDVKVARFKVSDHYRQAAFMGGGVEYAEDLLKSAGHNFEMDGARPNSQVDFDGLECRWQEVSQPEKTVGSILVKCNPRSDAPGAVYNATLKKLSDIYGFDTKTNPLKISELDMTVSIPKLWNEVKFRTFGQSWTKRFIYLLKMELQTLLGKFFMRFDYQTSATDWSLYKPDMAVNSDSRKFDDMLRLVISGTPDQHQSFEEYLQQRFEDGILAYGIHYSDAALITCMVQKYHREHVHFVDGKDGGYAYASRALKKRLKALAETE